MTCTPFTSSIYATCEATGVPRDIPFAYDGSQPSLSPRYGPDPSGVGLYASGSYGLLAYPRPVWHGPVGRSWTGGSGCGEGPWDAERVLPFPDDLGAPEGSTGDRGVRATAPRGERFRGPRISDGRGSQRRLWTDDRRRAEAHPHDVPTLRRPARRPAERVEARPVRPDDPGRQVLGTRVWGHEGEPDHATPRRAGLARRRRPTADQPEVRRRRRGGGWEPALRLVRPREQRDPEGGRRDDRGGRPPP